MTRRRGRLGAVLCVAVVCAPAAHADFGVVFGLTVIFHLAAGTLVIALGEARVLYRLWRVPYGGALLATALIDYATCGLAWLAWEPLNAWFVDAIEPDPLGRVRPATAVAIAAFVGVRVLALWPLVHAQRRRTVGAMRAGGSLGACAAAEALGLLLLAILYTPAANTALFSQVTPERGLATSGADDAWLWYLGEAGDLRRMRVTGAGDERLLEPGELGGPELVERFALVAGEGGRAELVLLPERGPRTAAEGRTLATAATAPPWSSREAVERGESVAVGRNARALRWVPTDELRWYAHAGVVYEGLSVFPCAPRSGTRMRVALILPPFAAWVAASPTILPDDRIVFQFGQWIMLLDPETRQIGKIARGRCLFAVPDEYAVEMP